MSGRVLITGATSGIGRQLALDYRRAGWQVWGCGRDEVRLQALADLGITPLRFDARDSAAMAGVAASLPALDLLILNAGNCEYMDPAEGFDGALFARVIDLDTSESGDMIYNKYDSVCSDLDDPEEPELLPEELELLKKLDAEEK